MYRKVNQLMIGSGVAALAVTAAYLAAALMAMQEGVELPDRLGSIAVALIVCLTLLAGCAWIARTANRESAQRDLPPIVSAAIEQRLDQIAGAVALRLVGCMEEVITAAGERSHARTVTALREIVTSELIQEEMSAQVQKTFRYGMAAEAAGRRPDNVAQIRRN